MRGALLLSAVLGAAAAAGPPYNPVPQPAATYTFGHARFTVLYDGLVRLQWSPNASTLASSDAASLAVVNRALPTIPSFNVTQLNATAVDITTPLLRIVYDDAAASARQCTPGQAGLDQSGGQRVPEYPNGTKATDAGECCTMCADLLDCTAWIYDTTGDDVCYLMQRPGPLRNATSRIFGRLSAGFTPASLRITATLPGMNATVEWDPSVQQAANLNGTYTHLDCYTTPDQCYDWSWQQMQPGLLARDGWSLLDDSATARYVPASDGRDGEWWAEAAVAAGSIQDWYFASYGSDFRGVLGQWSSLLGAQEIPDRSFFGPWWSQNFPWTAQTIVQDVLSGYRNNSIPLANLVLDMDWHKIVEPDPACATWGSWDFNTTIFPDPAGFISQLHNTGIVLNHSLSLSLNVHPQSGVDHCMERYLPFAQEVGFDASTNATVPCNMGNETWADALWDVYYDASPLSEVDLWWTDYDGCGGPGNGSDALRWSNLVYASMRESRSSRRALGFSRYGGLGHHRAPIFFSGDTFQHPAILDFEIQTTPISANVLGGYWSHDIGGFHGGQGCANGTSAPSNSTSAELYLRWIQFGSVAPIMRTHCGGCGPNPPPTCTCERRLWLYTSHSAWMFDAFRLRAALVPYLYTAARAAFDTGVSLVRPMYHDFPLLDQAFAATHQYMLGDDVIAAPIHEYANGNTTAMLPASVWLPPGAWTSWAGDAEIGSDGIVVDTRPYGMGGIPMFVRSDALLPLAENRTDTVASSSPGLMWTLFAPLGTAPSRPLAGNATCYEDDGRSASYRSWQGPGTPVPPGSGVMLTSASFAWAASSAVPSTLSVTVAPVVGGYAGAPPSRAQSVQIRGWTSAFGGTGPSSVAANGKPLAQGPCAVGEACWWIVGAGQGGLAAPEGCLLVQAGPQPISQATTFDVTV
jgi:alpha-glucosidase (family GH31 glycosyl hydrolase)